MTIKVSSGEATIYEDVSRNDGSSNSRRKYFLASYIDDTLSIAEGTATQETLVTLHRDRQYSTYAVTNNEGNCIERYAYSPYGLAEVFSENGTSLALEFTSGRHSGFLGRPHDSSSDTYGFRARRFSPSLGRFTQRDPAQYIDSFNLFEFLRSNPNRFLDPSGLACTTDPRCYDTCDKSHLKKTHLPSVVSNEQVRHCIW